MTAARSSSLLVPLLAATCARAERCCSSEELVLQLGEAAGTAEACESQLLSGAMRATSLSVKGVRATVFQWLSEALALPRAPGFEVDAEAVRPGSNVPRTVA